MGYQGNPGLYRPPLPEHASLPQSGSYEIAGARRDYLSWPVLFGTGITSASPAKQWSTQPRKGESPAQTRLRQLFEVLELPSELLDYHFAIQGCCSEMTPTCADLCNSCEAIPVDLRRSYSAFAQRRKCLTKVPVTAGLETLGVQFSGLDMLTPRKFVSICIAYKAQLHPR